VSTDGRRATVAFSTDWAEDARRRDFTMNALYADAKGEVFDLVGGIADLQARRVKFIGDPAQRIAEDYLRILRLFRFHAWYGRGEIDAAGLAASAAARAQIKTLSGERIQKEMLKLMGAEHPIPVLRAMAASGILGEVLRGELKFGRFQRLCEIDADAFFAADGLLRLGALIGCRMPTGSGCPTCRASRRRSSPIFRSRRCGGRFIVSVRRCSRIGCVCAGPKIPRSRTRINGGRCLRSPTDG
jgi:poly(A) polymerase